MTETHAPAAYFGWFAIARVGLIQASLGAIVVLTTSTLNRVMVVEWALPAILPGALVGWHYALQILRPRWGYGSDRIGRRSPWILGGMAILATGGALAAVATALMGSMIAAGIALAVLAFTLIGIGVGAAGTSLLVMLAERVEPVRRAAAATLVWMMMIVGFIVTAGTAGYLLDPFSPLRLVAITCGVSAIAMTLTSLALFRLEGTRPARMADAAADTKTPFRLTLAQVWSEPAARRFTLFIFVSMLAYSAQDLILEPYAGAVFGMTPGQSTQLGGLQHGGVLLGMVLVALAGTLGPNLSPRLAADPDLLVRIWMIGGCIASAAALAAIAAGGFAPDAVRTVWPLSPLVFALGVANGAFAIAAIGAMMAMAGDGKGGRDGTRLGLWGAAQAMAFGIGGLAGAAAVDVSKWIHGARAAVDIAAQGRAYAAVFSAEALLFLLSAALAVSLTRSRSTQSHHTVSPQGALAQGG